MNEKPSYIQNTPTLHLVRPDNRKFRMIDWKLLQKKNSQICFMWNKHYTNQEAISKIAL